LDKWSTIRGNLCTATEQGGIVLSVFKVIELVGESSSGWQGAVEDAVGQASKTIDGIAGVELINMTAKVENGKIIGWRANVKAAFEVKS
jgi:flavin-binding protein dodecin